MIMYKLVNNSLEVFNSDRDKYICFNSRVYTNPTEQQLRNAGYKTVVKADPIDVPEGYYVQVSYTEDADNIYEQFSLAETKLENEVTQIY